MSRAVRKRTYRSPAREAQALKTRQRILDASTELFGELGIAATTIEAIARKAKVSVPTVYAVFSTKQAIAAELVAELKREADVGALYRELMEERDPHRQLALAATITRRFCERGCRLMDSIGHEGKGDAALRALFDQIEQRRLRGIGALVSSLAERKRLKATLTVETARDIVWTLCAHDLYRLMVLDRGWTPSAYEAWLAGALVEGTLRR